MALDLQDAKLNVPVSIQSHAMDSVLSPGKIHINCGGKLFEYNQNRFCSSIAEILASETILPANSLRVKLIKAIATAGQVTGNSAAFANLLPGLSLDPNSKKLSLNLEISKTDIVRANKILITFPESISFSETTFVRMTQYVFTNIDLIKDDPRLNLQQFCKNIVFEELPDNKVKLIIPNKLSEVVLPKRKESIVMLPDIHSVAPLTRMLGVTIVLPNSSITFKRGQIILDKSVDYDEMKLLEDFSEIFDHPNFKKTGLKQNILWRLSCSETEITSGKYEINLNTHKCLTENEIEQKEFVLLKDLAPTDQADGVLISLVISLFNRTDTTQKLDPANFLNNQIAFFGSEDTSPIYVKIDHEGLKIKAEPMTADFFMSTSIKM